MSALEFGPARKKWQRILFVTRSSRVELPVRIQRKGSLWFTSFDDSCKVGGICRQNCEFGFWGTVAVNFVENSTSGRGSGLGECMPFVPCELW